MFSQKNVKNGMCAFLVVGITFLMAYRYGTAIMLEGFLGMVLLFCIFSRKPESVGYFTACTVFQNITLVILAPYIGSIETTILILLKELIVYAMMAFYFIRYCTRKVTIKECLAIAFFILAGLNLMTVSSLYLALISLRQILVIYACYYFGKSLRVKNAGSLKIIFESILFYGFLTCVLGLLLYSMTDQAWLDLGFASYWRNKTGGNALYAFTNFYTFDLGVRMKRMVSVFAEPLSCAHFLGISFVILFIAEEEEKFWLKSLMVLCLVLGLSKSSIILFISIIIILNYSKIRKSYLRLLFISACVLCGLFFLNVLSDYSVNLTKVSATSIHFNAFLYGIKNASLFGNGLGTAGYNADIMGLEDYDSGYNESFFSLCIGQAGIVGMLLIYLFMLSCVYSNYKLYRKTGNKYVLVSVVLLLAVLIESLFSASSISMLGTGLYFILAGVCSNLKQEEEMQLQGDGSHAFERIEGI